MTICEAIVLADDFRPNTFTTSQKIQWLSHLDGIVFDRVIATHEGAEQDSFTGYAPYMSDAELKASVLLIGPPYESVYVHYLEAQIDYANGEYGRYNNSTAMYQADLDAFSCWYNRTHTPVSKKRFLF